MVAKKLETKIRDALLSTSRSHGSATSPFYQDTTGLSNLQRPCATFYFYQSTSLLTIVYSVLLILDRNIDLVSVVSHGWTYQALVSDCLEMKLNRVIVTQPQKRSYDLDSKDFFWAKNAANPFPQVAEEIDVELNKYKQDAAEITRSTGVSDVTDISQLFLFQQMLTLWFYSEISLRMPLISKLPSLSCRS